MYEDYEKTRFNFDKKREIVWEEIVRYLQRYIRSDSSILELGSGYCSFINKIKGKKKYALDKYLNPNKYKTKEVIALFGDFKKMKTLENASLDIVFASNFFEHLTPKEFQAYLKAIKSKLKPKGRLIIVQPNFRFCYANYFDDHTHLKAWSDISLVDYLKSQNFEVLLTKPKFLPFTMKSKLPKSRLVVRAYLNSPFKPFAGQMLIIARPNSPNLSYMKQ